MADKKVESPKNTEIGEFKTPEELAKALEGKSNEKLAKRVREISGEVQGNSIDLRKKLQDELTPAEQKDIRETLPGSGIGKVFTKGMTEEEKAGVEAKEALAGVVGAENAENLEKVESYSKNFSDAMDIAGKLFDEGKYVAAIGVFLKGLFGKFNLKTWEKKDDEKKEEGKDGEKSGEINKNDLKYLGGIKMLYLIKGDESKKYTTSMLLQDEIKSKNFDELKGFYNGGRNGISTKLGLEKKGSDEEIYESLKLLIENENFMNGVLGKTNPEWKKGKLSENLLKISESGAYSIHGITQKLENISFSLNPIEAMNQLKQVDMLNISIENGKLTFGDLEDRKGLISDISNETLLKIIGTNETIKDSDEKQKNRLYGQSDGSEKEKAFIDKLLSFKKEITGTLSGMFGEDIKGKYSEFFNKNGLTVKEILELYMITGGKVDINSINGLEKSSLYLKLWKILGKDPTFRGEFFDKKIIEGINNKSLPEDVKMILGNIFSKVSEGFINASTTALKEIWKSIPIKDKIIVGGAIGVAMFLMFRFAPLRAVGITAIAGIIATALASTVNKNKYTKADIEKMIEESLKNNRI